MLTTLSNGLNLAAAAALCGATAVTTFSSLSPSPSEPCARETATVSIASPAAAAAPARSSERARWLPSRWPVKAEAYRSEMVTCRPRPPPPGPAAGPPLARHCPSGMRVTVTGPSGPW